MSCDEKYVCPLCGEEVKPSKEHGRDWMCIWCSNPNCLQPSTGWGTETMVVAKWKKYQKVKP